MKKSLVIFISLLLLFSLFFTSSGILTKSVSAARACRGGLNEIIYNSNDCRGGGCGDAGACISGECHRQYPCPEELGANAVCYRGCTGIMTAGGNLVQVKTSAEGVVSITPILRANYISSLTNAENRFGKGEQAILVTQRRSGQATLTASRETTKTATGLWSWLSKNNK